MESSGAHRTRIYMRLHNDPTADAQPDGGHDTIHRTVGANTDMSVEQTLVRGVAPTLATVVATMKFGRSTLPSGEVVSEVRTRGSFTTVKEGERWKIVHFENTVINAEAETTR